MIPKSNHSRQLGILSISTFLFIISFSYNHCLAQGLEIALCIDVSKSINLERQIDIVTKTFGASIDEDDNVYPFFFAGKTIYGKEISGKTAFNNTFTKEYIKNHIEKLIQQFSSKSVDSTNHSELIGAVKETLKDIWVNVKNDRLGNIATGKRKPIIIIMGDGEEDKEYFTAVIFASAFSLFPANPEKFYYGKKVRVSGFINKYKGKPEIILDDPSQIQILK